MKSFLAGLGLRYLWWIDTLFSLFLGKGSYRGLFGLSALWMLYLFYYQNRIINYTLCTELNIYFTYVRISMPKLTNHNVEVVIIWPGVR